MPSSYIIGEDLFSHLILARDIPELQLRPPEAKTNSGDVDVKQEIGTVKVIQTDFSKVKQGWLILMVIMGRAIPAAGKKQRKTAEWLAKKE